MIYFKFDPNMHDLFLFWELFKGQCVWFFVLFVCLFVCLIRSKFIFLSLILGPLSQTTYTCKTNNFRVCEFLLPTPVHISLHVAEYERAKLFFFVFFLLGM